MPFGINADEGDRAATAIQIIHGTNPEPIFGNGWYWISMVYFTLLADVLRVLGIGFAQARVLGAAAGVLTTAVVTWIGARHFGWRVGLLAGASYAALAVALQFARETTEAGPTALCWALSMACFLEAARGGRTWAWVGAGLAGGCSIYFYPSGRLWALLAAAWCAYLWLHGLGGQRRAIVRGSALAAVAALLAVGPFLLDWAAHPDLLTIRAAETSVFTGDNATRLDYYRAGWSTLQLLGAQLVHAVGAFNQFHDDGGFWPTDRPLFDGLLAMLTLLGLGWTMLRPRDPRLVALALWFWVGFAGVIVTVETPNVQRLATAVPVIAIFPALAIDQLARRAEWALSGRRVGRGAATRWAVQGLTALLVVVLAGQQLGFYFGTYGATDRWPQPTGLGNAVAGEGTDTLVVTVARQYHMVNAGWVQLLAPETPRGGVEAAGSNLPLALPADSNLTFLVFPRQAAFLPYLAGLYPGGTAVPVTHPTEGLLFTLYRVPRATWAAGQGALAWPPGGAPAVGVPALGAPPPGGTTYPSALTWTARLRVPQYWDYAFRAGPGPARLTIDGQAVLDVPAGTAALTTTVSLARGDHAVSYAGTLAAADAPAMLDWARVPGDAAAPLGLGADRAGGAAGGAGHAARAGRGGAGGRPGAGPAAGAGAAAGQHAGHGVAGQPDPVGRAPVHGDLDGDADGAGHGGLLDDALRAGRGDAGGRRGAGDHGAGGAGHAGRAGR